MTRMTWRPVVVTDVAHLCLLLLLGFGSVACTHEVGRAPREGDVIDVLTFDPSVADFYWYGHKLQPPVTFTLAHGGFRANGIAPVAFHPDTSGSSARLAPRYGGIRLVDSLVRHGSSYLEALNTMGCMALREPRLCIQAYRRHLTDGSGSPRAAALAVLTPGLWDVAAGIEVDASRFAGRMIIGTPIRITVPDTAGVSLADDPCSPHSSPDSVFWARQMVTSWRASFAGHRHVVVIATLSGCEAISGPAADRVRREIANARAAYRRGGRAALEAAATTSLVTRHSLEQIVGAEPGKEP